MTFTDGTSVLPLSKDAEPRHPCSYTRIRPSTSSPAHASVRPFASTKSRGILLRGPAVFIAARNNDDFMETTATDGLFKRSTDFLCVICLEECNVPSILCCGHHFHDECLDAWKKRSRSCPTCRMSTCIDHPLLSWRLFFSQRAWRALHRHDKDAFYFTIHIFVLTASLCFIALCAASYFNR